MPWLRRLPLLALAVFACSAWSGQAAWGQTTPGDPHARAIQELIRRQKFRREHGRLEAALQPPAPLDLRLADEELVTGAGAKPIPLPPVDASDGAAADKPAAGLRMASADEAVEPESLEEFLPPPATPNPTLGAFDAPAGPADLPLPLQSTVGPPGMLMAEPPAPVYSSGTTYYNGSWYVATDFMLLSLNEPREVRLGAEVSPVSLFTNRADSYSFEPGMRITLGRFLRNDEAGQDRLLEVTYAGLFSWSSEATFAGVSPGDLDTVLGPGGTSAPGFENGVLQAFEAETRWDSVEVNLRLRSRPPRDQLVMRPNGQWMRKESSSQIREVLIGIRGGFFEDRFGYASETANPAQDAGQYLVSANNNLLGIQFGGELLQKQPTWHVGVRGKLGPMLNFVERDSRVRTLVGGVATTRRGSQAETNVVFLSELSAFAGYQVGPHLSLRVAYEFAYLNGLARASENLGLDPVGFPELNTGGDALLQGLSVGGELIW